MDPNPSDKPTDPNEDQPLVSRQDAGETKSHDNKPDHILVNFPRVIQDTADEGINSCPRVSMLRICTCTVSTASFLGAISVISKDPVFKHNETPAILIPLLFLATACFGMHTMAKKPCLLTPFTKFLQKCLSPCLKKTASLDDVPEDKDWQEIIEEAQSYGITPQDEERLTNISKKIENEQNYRKNLAGTLCRLGMFGNPENPIYKAILEYAVDISSNDAIKLLQQVKEESEHGVRP